MSDRAGAGLGPLLATHHVVVCVGTGGVGKTTVAAALGLAGAAAGLRVRVLTIDPARRLAEALGMRALDPEGEVVDPARLRAAGARGTGVLSAAMLDTRRTWDALVARLSPSDEARRAILANPFYQALSKSFAGTSDYAAIEALGEAAGSIAYDLVVLDTPPAADALEFLEAPERLEAFLDAGVAGWLAGLARPDASPVWRRASRVLRFVLERLDAAVGRAALTQVADLFGNLSGLAAGVRARAESLGALLRGPQAAFVLVTAPAARSLEESRALADAVAKLGMTVDAVVANRAHPLPGVASTPPTDDRVRAAVRAWIPDLGLPVVDHLASTWRDADTLARIEVRGLEHFAEAFGPALPRVIVPEQAADVHDLDALVTMARTLCPDAFEPATPSDRATPRAPAC